jgi:hypothetical protein
MRQNDYEFIARILKDARPTDVSDVDDERYVYWRQLVHRFGYALEEANTGFNYDTFVAAAGGTS